MKRPSENGIRIFQTAWKGIDMPPLARNLALIALPPQVAGFVLLVILLGGDFTDFILGIGTLAVLGLLVASILYCLPITVLTPHCFPSLRCGAVGRGRVFPPYCSAGWRCRLPPWSDFCLPAISRGICCCPLPPPSLLPACRCRCSCLKGRPSEAESVI